MMDETLNAAGVISIIMGLVGIPLLIGMKALLCWLQFRAAGRWLQEQEEVDRAFLESGL